MSDPATNYYIIDSDVFIEAKDDYYRPAICPGFWDWLILKKESGIVTSIARIRKELQKGHDWLVTWSDEEGRILFPETAGLTAACSDKVADYVRGLSKSTAEKDIFLEAADSALVAYALYCKAQLGMVNPVVVTGEKSAKEAHAIKLPDVCEGLGIDCMEPFDMLEQENVRFVLEESKP